MVSISAIRRQMTPKVRERAEALLESGAVQQVIRRGRSLEALVRGSQTYTVTFELDQQDFPTALTCTCDYSFSGWCKHQGAAALAIATEQIAIQDMPTVSELIDQLSPDQLKTIARNWGEANTAALKALVPLQPTHFELVTPLHHLVLRV